MERMRLETKRGYIVAEKYKGREYSPEDIQTIVLDNLVGSIRLNTNGYELYIYEVSELDNSYFFIKTIRLEKNNKVSLEDMALNILIDDYNESCWIYNKDKIIDSRFMKEESIFTWLKKVV